jgi:transcriptional regulator with XRE-family HTH domain
MTKKQKGRIGPSLDDFLKEEGIYEVVTARAIKRVIARQLNALMQEQGISKTELAKAMKTSRAQLDRLLDPDNESVTLGTLTRAAQAVGAICGWSWCDAGSRQGVAIMARKNPHIGSQFDSWLDEEGIREEVTAAAIKAVIARQLMSEMKKKKITKQRMAVLMKTSRAQVDRLLDPDNGSATIESLQRAARIVGRELRLKLV